jgi:hypothetical protein
VQARAAYDEGRRKHSLALASLERRSHGIAVARLAVAAAALVAIGGIVWARFRAAGWGALTLLALGFAALVVLHSAVHDAIERARAGLRFHERGIARLTLAWDALRPSSERFRDANHPFTGDLDVFGRASVMQLVSATETRFGEERLAAWLSTEHQTGWPQTVVARQEAARELSSRLAFREAFAMAGAILADEKPDPTPILTWAEGNRGPSPAQLRWLSLVAWGQPVLLAAVLALGPLLGFSARIETVVCVGGIVLGLAAGAGLAPMLDTVSARGSTVTRWGTMMAALEREPFDAPLLQKLRAVLENEGRLASGEVAGLDRIVGFIDARQNELFRFLVGPLLMWDVHCAVALLRWRVRAGARLRVWLDTLAEAEAIASLAAFAFEHPEFAWPELTPDALLEARSLGHPLIAADRRVVNDVRLPMSGHALVVTGSNMSGKSTLLRSLGVNAVLAAAGAPVCASGLRIGPLRLATSMRISDSLEQGVSHFYAELQRLKGVIDRAHEPGHRVFFLLDEILHGTNSRERIIGACAIVRELLSLGALGAVSTHDLGITALASELSGRVENAHFEEQVRGDAMTFDYVLRPGIVQSSNALRLMRAVGIAVPEATECR